MDKSLQKNVIKDFVKAFSCAYSMTSNLCRVLDVEANRDLLNASVGFSSGVSTMGDTCGTVNGGIMALGEKFADSELSDEHFNILCAEYFRRLTKRVGAPDCGRIHGGKHLANNFRRAVLTGKIVKCASILNHGSGILADLAENARNGGMSDGGRKDYRHMESIATHFAQEKFHCCRTTIDEISEKTNLRYDEVHNASRGFCGGIGYNGTLCGAISAGVLCLGLKSGVDLGRSSYRDTAGIVFQGLIKSDGIFRDEKRFKPARLFSQCQTVYKSVDEKFGGAHCREILGLDFDSKNGVDKYIRENKIHHCRKVIETVAEAVAMC